MCKPVILHFLPPCRSRGSLSERKRNWRTKHNTDAAFVCVADAQQGEQDTGAGVARAAGYGLAWVARAWRGRGTGLSCAPRRRYPMMKK
eukprot:gene6149-biopygen22317